MHRIVSTMVVALVAIPALSPPAHAAPDRAQPCAEAWTLIAQERAGLDQNDLSAWSRVNDGFLSMSDATFDGPLSNAFGNVSAAAEVITISLQSDDANDPSRVDFDTALGALGTVCAQLVATSHRERPARFQRFGYQTGKVTGLNAEATTQVNAALGRVVERAVKSARRGGSGACMGTAKRCAYFVQTLRQAPCVAGVVCLRSQVGLLPSGANDSQGVMTTLPLDALNGQAVPLSRFVSEGESEGFIQALNAAIIARLEKGGIVNDPYWKPNVTEADARAWLPQPDGIHVWFDKYAVAPGSFGIVHVVVPWPGGTASG